MQRLLLTAPKPEQDQALKNDAQKIAAAGAEWKAETVVRHVCSIDDEKKDSSAIAIVDETNAVTVRHVRTGAVLKTKNMPEGIENRVMHLCFAQGLLFCEQLNKTTILNAETLEEQEIWDTEKLTYVTNVMDKRLQLDTAKRISDDLLLCHTSSRTQVDLFRVSHADGLQWLNMFTSGCMDHRDIESFTYLPESKSVAMGLNTNKVNICTFSTDELDPSQHFQIATDLEKANFIASLAGNKLAVGCKTESKEFVVNILDVSSQKVIATFSTKNKSPVGIFQPIMNGRGLLIGQMEPGNLYIWDFAANKLECIELADTLNGIFYCNGLVKAVAEKDVVVFELLPLMVMKEIMSKQLYAPVARLALQYLGVFSEPMEAQQVTTSSVVTSVSNLGLS
jgi:hypothetical protein